MLGDLSGLGLAGDHSPRGFEGGLPVSGFIEQLPRPQEHQRYHYRHAAEDRGQQLKQSARDTAEGLSDTTDQLREVLDDVQDWVRDQTHVRPVAMTASAFALGYVLGGGIPRWLARFGARVGLPMAAAGAFARYIATAGTDRPSEGLQ